MENIMKRLNHPFLILLSAGFLSITFAANAIALMDMKGRIILHDCDLQKALVEPAAYYSLPLPLNVYLNGTLYTVTRQLGDGAEGIVFAIKDLDGNEFALKIHKKSFFWSSISGDELAMNHVHAAKDFINVPCVVNKKYNYSIAPLLDITLQQARMSTRSDEEYNRIQEAYYLARYKVVEALAKDYLFLCDGHDGNYMYTKDGTIKRIDFGGLWRDIWSVRRCYYWYGKPIRETIVGMAV
jgi:hypothetical protein